MVLGQNPLMNVGGNLPSKDVKTFNEILSLVKENWDLTKPVDLMLANRMVATFMKLKYAEREAESSGLLLNDRLNPLLTYCRDLQCDLMKFYKLFQVKVQDSPGPANFSDWINDNAKETK